jgi:hypothetical protein
MWKDSPLLERVEEVPGKDLTLAEQGLALQLV